jgi:hypothetical protein
MAADYQERLRFLVLWRWVLCFLVLCFLVLWRRLLCLLPFFPPDEPDDLPPPPAP